MQILFKNIKFLFGTHHPNNALRGAELANLPMLENAFLIVENGLIKDFGTMQNFAIEETALEKIVDCSGKSILPAYCDSHTHIVFAATRENEFLQKLQGKTYAEIAANGGGILNSAKALQQMPEAELYEMAWQRLAELIQLGTGAIEIKSGYGLTVAAELKMLRVIKKLKENSPIPVKATFLAAHTFPLEYKENEQAYVDVIINDMLPIIAQEKLADYVDVFCEKGFFSVAQMEQIVLAAMQIGLKPKLHINQLNSIGGLQKAIALHSLTVDHLETMTEQDCTDLGNSNTIGTMLPTAAYFLRMQMQPARQMINANAALALASDYNPGSSPSGNMNMVVSMACIQLKMLPEEAINAATINGAFAMELQEEVGSITIGKKANFILTKPIPNLAYLPYSFGSNFVDKVYINGISQ
jgi:imidazolonepropionase